MQNWLITTTIRSIKRASNCLSKASVPFYILWCSLFKVYGRLASVSLLKSLAFNKHHWKSMA